jgi:hypothetical protein
MQKSGTSAIAALLAAATGLTCSIDFIQEQRRPLFDRVYLHQAPFERLIRRNKPEFSQGVVKEPNLTILYPQLARRFPRAQFIFVVRDPRDNIRSILDWLGWPGDVLTIAPQEWNRLSKVKQRIVSVDWMGLGESDESHIAALTRKWTYCADQYLDSRDSMQLIRYEDFLLDKVGAIHDLASRVGLEPSRPIEHIVDKAFQPPGRRDVKLEEIFGRESLRTIETMSRKYLDEFRYPLHRE